MITKNIPNIIIAGPTASGKTKLSIELAKKIKGEIINADIMQMYKGFEILKAVPSKEEKSHVKLPDKTPDKTANKRSHAVPMRRHS